MTALKRRALEWISEECDPRLDSLREWFGLTEPQSHRLVSDLLGTGRDRIVSGLIPLVFDMIAEERKRETKCVIEP